MYVHTVRSVHILLGFEQHKHASFLEGAWRGNTPQSHLPFEAEVEGVGWENRPLGHWSDLVNRSRGPWPIPWALAHGMGMVERQNHRTATKTDPLFFFIIHAKWAVVHQKSWLDSVTQLDKYIDIVVVWGSLPNFSKNVRLRKADNVCKYLEHIWYIWY